MALYYLPGLFSIPWFLYHYGSEEVLNGNFLMLNNHFMLIEHCEVLRETLSVLLLFGLTERLEGWNEFAWNTAGKLETCLQAPALLEYWDVVRLKAFP